MNKVFQSLKNNPWKIVFWLFLIIALCTTIRLSLDAGFSGDEEFQMKQAKAVYDFYASGGKDTTAIAARPDWNLPHYGQTVDNVAYFIAHFFSIEDQLMVRHICNSICGWLMLLFGGLIAHRITGNWRSAFFVAILMFLSPRLLGHSFNNLKDVGFAMTMLWGIYAIIVYLQEFPKPKISTFILLGASIAFAIAMRIGGLLLIPYLGMFSVIYLFKLHSAKNIFKKDSLKDFGKMVLYGIIVSVAGYFVAMLFWPYGLVSPIDNPVETFKAQSQFATAIRQLFEGSLQWSDVLPWYYTPKYIFMTIPIAVIIGVILFFVFCWIKKENRFWAFFVFFTFFFPVFWIVYTHANVYGGWRHAMFSYPPMVVAAGWGFDALVKWVESKLGINNEQLIINNGDKETEDDKVKTHTVSSKGIIVNVASVIVLLVLLIGPIRHIIANHPYEYVYFNELEGGIDKAYGNYEMDYYYHSTREASEWIIANAEPNADGSKIKVATWHIASVGYFFRNDTARFTPLFCRWYEKGNNDWDYAIFTITGMAPEQITNKGAFPPPDCIKTIDVDGKPICLILKRQSKIDMLGNQYKSKNQVDSAIICFKEALAINPYNEAALNNIIECYLMRGQLDSAKIYIDQELSFLPKYETANYFLAHYYMTKGEMDKAIETCKFIIDCNFKFTSAYHLMCNIYLRQNDIKNAEKALSQLIDHDQLDNAGVQQLINIYKADGLDDRGAYRKLYKKIAKSLENRGKKEEPQIYWDLYKQLR